MPTPLPVKTATAAPVELDFFDALREVRDGKKITRVEWASEACLFLHVGALHLRKPDGTLHTLIVTDADIDATDWVVVREQ